MNTPVLWEYTALSVIGTSHEKVKLPCQDACRIETVKQFLIAVIADGAGSAKHSDIGARLITEETITLIEAWQLFDEGNVIWKQHVSALIESLRAKLQGQAENMQCEIRELATTFLLVILSPSWFVGAQIGDGAIVYAKEHEEAFHLLILPKGGEYLNETTFITSENYQENLQIVCHSSEGIDRIALFSDGLQMLALNMKNDPPEPHPTFFHPFFESLQSVADNVERRHQLKRFLQSPRVCSRTDDDKTLIFAAKQPVLHDLPKVPQV